MEIKITDKYVLNDETLNKIIHTYIQNTMYLAIMGKILSKHYDANGLDMFSAPEIIERFLKNPKWDFMNVSLEELVEELPSVNETTVEELDKFIKSYIQETKIFNMH